MANKYLIISVSLWYLCCVLSRSNRDADIEEMHFEGDQMINKADILLNEYMNVEGMVEEGVMDVGNELEDISPGETKNVVCRKGETKSKEGVRMICKDTGDGYLPLPCPKEEICIKDVYQQNIGYVYIVVNN